MKKSITDYYDALCVPGDPTIGFTSIENNFLVAMDGREYSLVDNIPQLIEDDEYNNLSELYDEKSIDKYAHSAVGYWFASHYRRMHNAFHQCLSDIPPGNNILDIGCGHGELTHNLVGSHSVFGLDVSQSMLRLAGDKGLFPIRANALKIPIKTEYMDICIAAEMLQHMNEIQIFFDEIARVLKPGGRALVSTLNRRSLLRRINRLLKGMSYTDVTVLRFPEEVLLSATRSRLSHISTTCIYWPVPFSDGGLDKDKRISLLATNFIVELKK